MTQYNVLLLKDLSVLMVIILFFILYFYQVITTLTLEIVLINCTQFLKYYSRPKVIHILFFSFVE